MLRPRSYLKVVTALIIILDLIYFISHNTNTQDYIPKFRQQSTRQELDLAHDFYDIDERVSKIQLTKSTLPQRLRSLFKRKSYELASDNVKDQVKKFKNFGQFDRRLLPGLWLNLISQHLVDGSLPDDFTLPFNWDLLNNVAERITSDHYFEKIVRGKLNCGKFRDIAPHGLPPTFLQNFCWNYNYEDPNFVNDYKLPFKVVRKVDQYLLDVNWRRIHGKIHLLTLLEIPSSVFFMGGFGKESHSLMVPLQQVSNGKNDLTRFNDRQKFTLETYYDTLTENFIKWELEKNGMSEDKLLLRGVSVYEELLKLNTKFSTAVEDAQAIVYKPQKPVLLGKSTTVNIPQDTMPLDKSLFKWFLPDEIENLRKDIQAASKDDNTKQLSHLIEWARFINNPENKQPWYYGIPSIYQRLLDHYDWRFFDQVTYELDPETHVNVLHRLARTWFKLCHVLEIPSWLNHGTLIGWYWNGASMPFDGDLDLQMPVQSLHHLLKFFNNTLIYDFSDDTSYVNDQWQIDTRAEMGARSYLFDIDPMYFDRNQINSRENDIDARLIDTETGLYIDLTLLLDFHSQTKYDLSIQKKFLEKADWTHSRLMIPTHLDNFYDKTTGKFVRDQDRSARFKQELIQDIDSCLKDGNKDSMSLKSPTRQLFEDFVHCKHFHTYNLNQLFPLIPAPFENTVGYLPSNWYRNTLIDYGSLDSLEHSYFNHIKFWPGLQQWISHKECPVWDFHSGEPNQGQTEQDVILQCMEMNPLVEKQLQTGFHYGLQHQLYKSKMKIGIQGEMEYDYALEMLPLLEKYDMGHLMKAEPFVSRNLY